MPKTDTLQTTMLIRLPRPLKAEIKDAAAEEEMSINELCRYIMRSWLDERKRARRTRKVR